MMKKFSSFSKDSPQRFWHSENELPMGNIEAYGLCDPVAGLANSALVTARAEVAGFAGKGEQFFVTAIGAKNAGESGSEISTSVELVYDIDGVGAQWSVNLAMSGFVIALEFTPRVVDELPQW